MIFIDFISLFKMQKGGYFPQESRADGCDMACKATWQRHADPRERLCGAEVAWTRGKATRVHVDARMAPMWQCERLAGDGPMG